ncbi:hypothetical protein FRZ67_18110 [Panacibacter ginsenosidivorans]|uniref:Uncharacterized protein n=1 Tax=Panacibacter ginsenosidivorans TaxID=1813871 RepID=A0A5B8VCF3_9BACT|nr:hypothetical protein [Panacibacter ginsenosidivorans]QEC69134.1 hypothetical protein FRZ67_18110 [Panacibacter ginsenosidivorans]
MKNLGIHAKEMRLKVYRHMLETRGSKYRSFLRYLRFFKYISFTWRRGDFLESYYTLMRYLDDIVDGDAPLPDGYNNGADYMVDKIKFSRNPVNPVDEVDYLMLYCFNVAEGFGETFHEETTDILNSLLFDARRRGKLMIFPEKELSMHFHILDIRGTIKATLKIFKEDPAKYPLLEPLGTASRYEYDLDDFEDDIKAGYVNISAEDCSLFGIGADELHNKNSDAVRAWFAHHAQKGMELLEEHHRLLPQGKFSLLARGTFPLVYELPAKRLFERILAGHKKPVQKIVYEFNA